ncbi:uncharacterized protein LOC114255354 [Monomorium pharaonis]|uniref:uncharacterized protein LOC114255354 n=1 Tax=Monomorium pharaonis TaxID=307658 RepID=UPI0017475570|nr:uncharacterized protein LOC114255354 [Monomorium pharaonis]
MRGDLKLSDINVTLPYVRFSMFDRHAGYQVALTVRLHLYRIILERLLAIPGNMLLNEDEHELIKGRDLVTGAIKLAYRQMDQMMEMQAQNGDGGCTAITILFLNR